MPDATSQTPADRTLAEEASRLAGLTVTPGQIRRWRKAGLLPMTRKGLGRGRGFRYTYPPGSAGFAARIAIELPRYRRLDLAARAAFAHGVPPAATEVLVRMLDRRDVVAPVLDDPHRFAARASNKASRRASTYPAVAQVKESLDRPGQLADVLRAGFDSTVTGEAAGFQQALRLLNVSEEAVQEMTGGIEAQFGGPGALEQSFQITGEVLRTATLAEFERARDDALFVYEATVTLMSILAELVGFTEEVGADDVEAIDMVPLFLVVRRRFGDEQADGLLAMWTDPMSIFGPVVDAMRTWSGEHPDDAAILWPIARTVAQRALGP